MKLKIVRLYVIIATIDENEMLYYFIILNTTDTDTHEQQNQRTNERTNETNKQPSNFLRAPA